MEQWGARVKTKNLMGDWGPGYNAPQSAAASTNSLRCGDCGMRQSTGTSCALCGGDLQRVGGTAGGTATGNGGAAAQNNPSIDAVAEQAEQILQAILPAELLEAAGGDAADRPADQAVLDELPLIKIEPYVLLHVTAAAAAAPIRELLADAAERRARGEATKQGEDDVDISDAPASSSSSSNSSSSSSTAAVILELRATASSFGTPLADFPEGVTAPLVLAEPRDGAAELSNAAAVSGKVAVLVRGGCSFVDKVRRAQAAGAVTAVVVQAAGQKWPFTMSDTAGKGTDILLPSLMVSPTDGEALLKALEESKSGGGGSGGGSGSGGAEGSGGGGLCAHARAHNHHTSCAVCLQEFQAEELAVQLPCKHLFHEGCVRTWLKKQHTCPTCREPLATLGDAAEDESRDGGGMTLGDAADPRSWLLSRGGNQPMSQPASGMYT